MTPSPSPLRIRSAAAILVAFFVLGRVSAQVTFVDLGPGTRGAQAVSDDGSVVIGPSASGAGSYRWTAETGAVLIDPLPGSTGTFAWAISGDGAVIVGAAKYPDSVLNQPVRWTEDGGVASLAIPDGAAGASAEDVSGDGTTVVGSTQSGVNDFGGQAVRWVNSDGPELLELLPGGDHSSAHAIAKNAPVIVGSAQDAAGVDRAVRWTDSGVEALGTLAGGSASGLAVSADGKFAVGLEDRPDTGVVEGFRWSEETGMVGLGLLDGAGTLPSAISGDGSLIVGTTASEGMGAGFVWTPLTGVVDFLEVLKNDYGLATALAGWDALFPTGMSVDGRFIVGSALLDGEISRGWLLDRGASPPPIGGSVPISPVPEPATYGMLGALMLVAALLHRRHAFRRTRGSGVTAG